MSEEKINDTTKKVDTNSESYKKLQEISSKNKNSKIESTDKTAEEKDAKPKSDKNSEKKITAPKSKESNKAPQNTKKTPSDKKKSPAKKSKLTDEMKEQLNREAKIQAKKIKNIFALITIILLLGVVALYFAFKP